MAIALKNLSGAQLLDLLKIDPELVTWLYQHQVAVVVTVTAVVFKAPDGQELAAVPVKHSHLDRLQKGTLATDALTGLGAEISAAIVKIKEDLMSTVGALELLKKKQPEDGPLAEPVAEAQVAKASQTAWSVFDTKQLTTAEPVKLRDATMMYQPVRGSSAHSRYFMVAANQDLRVAARYKGSSLSVRIEGPAWEKYKHKIATCGFDNISLEKGYASLHLAVPDDVLAGKTLGAVLLGLGVPLETPVPDLSVIKDAGA